MTIDEIVNRAFNEAPFDEDGHADWRNVARAAARLMAEACVEIVNSHNNVHCFEKHDCEMEIIAAIRAMIGGKL